MRGKERTKNELMRESPQTRQPIVRSKPFEAKRKQVEEAQEESDTKYSVLAELADDGVVIVQDGIHKSANKAMSEISGYEIDEIVGMPFLGIVLPECRDLVASRVKSRVTGKPITGFHETRIRCKDGTAKDVQLATAVVQLNGRRAIMAIVRDATGHMHAEEALQQSEEQFKSIYAESPIAIEIHDSGGRLIGANQASLNMYELSDIAEFRFQGLFDNPYIPDQAKQRVRDGEVVRFEVCFDFDEARRRGLYRRKKSGTSYFDVVISPFGMGRSFSRGYLQQIQDVTERRRVEQALRDLSRRLVEVQEVERRRIARELHDQIGQALTGLKLTLEMALRRPAENLGPSLNEAQALINELMTRITDLSLDLRPSMLDDLGLLPTLLWHFERYTAQTGVRVVFEHNGLQPRLAPEIETGVYRIVQEALTNIARHADVQEADVRLSRVQHALIVKIEDRGTGFDSNAAFTSGASSGLVGMRERAISLGGRLVVNSAPGRGTSLVADLPLSESIAEKKKNDARQACQQLW